MSTHSLRTYLRNHLAGARAALRVLKDLRRIHAGDEIGELASELHHEVSADRAVLRRIGKHVGVRRSLMKDAAGWITAQLSSRVSDKAEGLDTFQKLEALSLGIEGKKMLWKTLSDAARIDRRLAGFDYEDLIQRAGLQRDKVDQARFALATSVFAPRK